uniref:Uncharacterized protein n=1 Tax=Arundo donax TaxID=35708 RepID=A0A0A9GL66_ARUDO
MLYFRCETCCILPYTDVSFCTFG